MRSEFWIDCWNNNDIGFHEEQANPLLTNNFNKISLNNGDKVLLPLCGKTSSIPWLMSLGYCVVGIELSKLAIEQLFTDLAITPSISTVGNIHKYSAENIEIFVGDIFEISQQMLGNIAAVYDRGALVALPENMRQQYTSHLMQISAYAPQLLICYDYQQSLMQGPPFAINQAEVVSHYQDKYQITLLESQLAGFSSNALEVKENAWLLTAKIN